MPDDFLSFLSLGNSIITPIKIEYLLIIYYYLKANYFILDILQSCAFEISIYCKLSMQRERTFCIRIEDLTVEIDSRNQSFISLIWSKDEWVRNLKISYTIMIKLIENTEFLDMSRIFPTVSNICRIYFRVSF